MSSMGEGHCDVLDQEDCEVVDEEDDGSSVRGLSCPTRMSSPPHATSALEPSAEARTRSNCRRMPLYVAKAEWGTSEKNRTVEMN